MKFERGTQIAYIPSHAEGNRKHQDVEYGFVTSYRGDNCFCRYWFKDRPGQLRTLANSELTGTACIIAHVSVPQSYIDKLLNDYGFPE